MDPAQFEFRGIAADNNSPGAGAMRSVVWGIVAALAFGSGLAAQEETKGLTPGQVIRVSGKNDFRFTGEYLGQDSSGLVIRPADGDTRKVPFAWIKKVELRTGHKSGAGKGAVIGAGTGAVLGLVAVGGVDNSSYWGDSCCSEGDYASGGFLFAAAGAGLGAIAGALTHKD